MGHVVFALPGPEVHRSTPWSATKRWMADTKLLEMGSMSAEDTKRNPRWHLKKPTTPNSCCSRGW